MRLLLLSFLLVLPCLGLAQTTNLPPVDPALSIEELDLKLRPLDQAELKLEAEAWMASLKLAVSRVSDLEIALLNDDEAPAPGSLDQARSEQADVIERLDRVLEALQAKGGEVEGYQRYVKAVSGLNLEASDVSGLWKTINTWLLSKDGGMKWALDLLKFFLVIFIFKILASVAEGIMKRAMDKARLSALLENFMINTTRRVVFFLGLLVALSFLGFEIGPFLAGIGVMGFVLGFALQNTLSNFAAGFMILVYRPYDIGDAVSAAGVTGGVVAMSLVSTTIKTWDNQKVVVPNSKIWGDIITNITGNPTRRIDLVFGIGYDDDAERAKRLLMEIVTAHEKVLKEPEPVVRVDALADSSVNLVCRPWVNTSEYAGIRWDLIETVKKRFDEEGISFPYPQRDVHMHTAES